MTKRQRPPHCWHFLVFILLRIFPHSHSVPENNQKLYAILGVKRTASTREIKKAYRRKALESHPDKNINVPPEQAAEEFQRVVHAFEILSDKNARKLYDRTGRTDTTKGSSSGGFTFHFNRRPPGQQQQRRQQQQSRRVPLRDQFKVQEAMSRVLHVASLQQLKTVMLKDDEVNITKTESEQLEEHQEEVVVANETMVITRIKLVTKVTTIKEVIQHDTVERHLLMAFCTPGRIEQMVDEDLVFPYPFAALSKQGIWWEEFLQTVKVRYYDQTKLTRYFDLPDRQQLRAPIFIFVKEGHTLKDHSKLVTNRRDKFTHWVWEQLKVDVEFINRHDRNVDIWWVHDDQVKYQSTLEPDHIASLGARLSHTFWIRDSRVNRHLTTQQLAKLKKDDLLSENSTLEVINIVKGDAQQTFTIDIKGCMDLSTTCQAWRDAKNCTNLDLYALSHTSRFCKKTCGKCSVADDYAVKKERDRCKDHEGSCRIWARQGECSKNEAFMKVRCPYSCQFCDPNDDGKSEEEKRKKNAEPKKKTTRKKKNQKPVVPSSDSDDDTDSDEDAGFDSGDEEFDFMYSSDSDDEGADQRHDEL